MGSLYWHSKYVHLAFWHPKYFIRYAHQPARRTSEISALALLQTVKLILKYSECPDLWLSKVALLCKRGMSLLYYAIKISKRFTMFSVYMPIRADQQYQMIQRLVSSSSLPRRTGHLMGFWVPRRWQIFLSSLTWMVGIVIYITVKPGTWSIYSHPELTSQQADIGTIKTTSLMCNI